MGNNSRLCSANGWSVSCTTGTGIDGAKLSVAKMREHMSEDYRRRSGFSFAIQRGDGDGRLFKTIEDAWEWSRQHGYLEPYCVPWCRDCRQIHRIKIGRRHMKLMLCPNRQAVGVM